LVDDIDAPASTRSLPHIHVLCFVYGLVSGTYSNVPFYYFQFLGEDDDDEMILDEFHEELGLLKCYLQLTENGKFHEPRLENFLEEYEDTLCYSIPCNPYEIVQRILMSLDKHKENW
jgi:hypothetical protein